MVFKKVYILFLIMGASGLFSQAVDFSVTDRYVGQGQWALDIGFYNLESVRGQAASVIVKNTRTGKTIAEKDLAEAPEITFSTLGLKELSVEVLDTEGKTLYEGYKELKLNTETLPPEKNPYKLRVKKTKTKKLGLVFIYAPSPEDLDNIDVVKYLLPQNSIKEVQREGEGEPFGYNLIFIKPSLKIRVEIYVNNGGRYIFEEELILPR